MKRISLGDWIVWNPAASQALGFRPDDAPPGGPALTSLIQFRRTKLICSAHSGPAACLSLSFMLDLDQRKETDRFSASTPSERMTLWCGK